MTARQILWRAKNYGEKKQRRVKTTFAKTKAFMLRTRLNEKCFKEGASCYNSENQKRRFFRVYGRRTEIGSGYGKFFMILPWCIRYLGWN
jgi:hypothetical protein